MRSLKRSMRRTPYAALALAALTLAAFALPAQAGAAPATVLVVIAKLESRHQESKRAFSFRQQLLRARVKVGSSRVRCELRSKRFAFCRGSYRLMGGAIKVGDDIRRGTRNPTLDIVKGTGAFAGAAGTMHVENLNNHTSRNTFRLTGTAPQP